MGVPHCHFRMGEHNRNTVNRFVWEVPLELSVTRLHLTKADKVETRLLQFHVFDGACRVVIEARSEEDVACLCSEMGWELICACES